MISKMYEKLRGELFKLFLDGDNLVDGDELWLDLISDSMDSKRVLEIAREIKENGNFYFKAENFEEALERYGYAQAILARYNFEVEDDRKEFCDLVLCILLNSAACLSKLKDFEEVGHVCTIVLDFQPNNVKAMFRRAMAAVELGRYEWAFWDLVSAAEINPNNKEITKLLEEVRESIKKKKKKDQSPSKCPKGLGLGLPSPMEKSRNELPNSEISECPAMFSKQEVNGMVKEAIIVDKEDGGDIMQEVTNENGRDLVKLSKEDEKESSPVREIINTEGNSNDEEKAKEINDVKMEDAVKHSSNSEVSSTITVEDDTSSVSCNDQQLGSPNLGESTYRFHNRNRRGSSLTISRENYQLMAQGKTLKFYNAKLGSVLEVKFVSKLDEKVTIRRNNHSKRSTRSDTFDSQPNLSENKANKADSEEVQSEVESCVSFEDEHYVYDKDTYQIEDECVTSSTSIPSVFRFSANSESKRRRKHYAHKARGLSRVPAKQKKRRKMQDAENASLFHANFVGGCRLKVSKKRKLVHLHPLDLHHHSRKKIAPHDYWSNQCFSSPSVCNHVCSLGCTSTTDVASLVNLCPNVPFQLQGHSQVAMGEASVATKE